MSRDFVDLLNDYFHRYSQESELRIRYEELLSVPKAFYRTGRPGHFTASALILDKDMSQVLLVEHRKLGIWLQPGGHADGDENLEKAAGKEIEEETGLTNWSCDGQILDLDIHPIPARKNEGPHDHYDVRFLFFADPSESITISHESTDMKWILMKNVRRYTEEISTLRMLEKAGAAGF